MPRPVKLDRNLALQAAMLLFWRAGYQQTSMRDLTEATHLQPGSLYGAFGSKRGLFLKALDHYSEGLRAFVAEVLKTDAPPLQRIQRFFDRLLEETDRDPDGKGCLLVSTLMETPRDEPEIAEHAARALRHVEATFVEVLEEARATGALAPDADPAALAKLLMTGIFGLRVYARLPASPETLRGIVDSLLSVLRP